MKRSPLILAAILASGATLASEQVDFDQHDENNDGFLTHNEWSDVDISFNDVDANNDKLVTREEIRDAGLESALGGRDTNADNKVEFYEATEESVFGIYDTDNDGYISEDDIQEDPYIEANFDTWDEDADGRLAAGDVDDEVLEWNEDRFDEYDANDDDLLDASEVDNYDYVDYNFSAWDADGDGFLDRDEASETWMEEASEPWNEDEGETF